MKYILAFIMFAALVALLATVMLISMRLYADTGPSWWLLLPAAVACAVAGMGAGTLLDQLEHQDP